MTNLLDKLKKELSNGLPFMEGKEKGSLVTDTIFTIDNFGFLKDKNTQEPYVCFTVKETNYFYFGGGVVTDTFKRIENVLSENEIAELLSNGLQVVFKEQRSKDNMRTYMVMEII